MSFPDRNQRLELDFFEPDPSEQSCAAVTRIKEIDETFHDSENNTEVPFSTYIYQNSSRPVPPQLTSFLHRGSLAQKYFLELGLKKIHGSVW